MGRASGATNPVVHLGARYDARSENSSYMVSVWVASRPKRNSTFALSFRQGRCSDGGAYSGVDFPLRHQGFKISATGVAGFIGHYRHAYTFNRRGRKVVGHERFAVLLQFAGDQVTGVLTDVFVARRLRCSSGPVAFTAWRDGTPQAPLNTSYATTGRYHGRSDYGDSMSMDVFLPLRVVASVRITFQRGLFCSGGLTVRRPIIVRSSGIPITGTSFRFSGHYSYASGGYRYRERWSMTGNPIRDPVWTFVVTSWRNGRHLGTCRTAQFGGDEFRLTPPHHRQV